MLNTNTLRMEEPNSEVEVLEKIEKQHQIVVYNDNVNTFEHVIMCLIIICSHEMEQAEQCAMMIHHKGKCGVKSGGMDELIPIAEALDREGLHIQIV
jgi:ATP-dependent Clp protease adaptor protein ClpS